MRPGDQWALTGRVLPPGHPIRDALVGTPVPAGRQVIQLPHWLSFPSPAGRQAAAGQPALVHRDGALLAANLGWATPRRAVRSPDDEARGLPAPRSDGPDVVDRRGSRSGRDGDH